MSNAARPARTDVSPGNPAAPARDDREILRDLEAFIDAGRVGVHFPGWLEARFEEDTRATLARRLVQSTPTSLILYNSFLVSDFVLMPETLGLASALHFLAVTPLLLLAGRVFAANPRRIWREIAAATIPTAMVLQILCVYILSPSGNAPLYAYFVIMVTIVTNTSLHLSHRCARWATFVTFLLLTVTFALTRKSPFAVSLVQATSFVVCGHASIRAAFQRERDFRRSYLYRLRDRLRVEAMDAEARQDALTGLANRRGLDAAADALWACPGADASPVAAILFDVDRFKAFNDRYGHPAGDGCLKRLAACASAELRGAEDCAARYGGEEFMILLPKTSLTDAIKVAERLRLSIAALGIPHAGAENRIVTASFGVACAMVSKSSFAELTSAADEALYAAKRGGRNRVAAAPVPKRAVA
jgi:diguanylate cyclase (GGDEF)-like protein